MFYTRLTIALLFNICAKNSLYYYQFADLITNLGHLQPIKDFTNKIVHYIHQCNLEWTIFDSGKDTSNRGWLNKDEFLTLCLCKSTSLKRLYELNRPDEIKTQIKNFVFNSVQGR